jgi:pimeloyl-ACP methyl ester carboxylesterase
MTYLRANRQPRLRWIITVALLAGLAGLVLSQVGAGPVAAGPAAAGAARAGAATSQGGSKPTVVLVHGAWADSGSWDQVVARLQSRGYTVIAFPNPLRGLPDDSAYLAAFLETISGPIVLVGHSYGGAVITNAATGHANVEALVYSTPSSPPRARPSPSWWAPNPAPAWPATPPRSSTCGPILALHQERWTPMSSRACSRPVSPTTCQLVRPRCWPPPSGPPRP